MKGEQGVPEMTGSRTGLDGKSTENFGGIRDKTKSRSISSKRLRSDALGKRTEEWEAATSEVLGQSSLSGVLSWATVVLRSAEGSGQT